ncbi:MAG: hypothetical protein IJL62_00735 [Clostridia bacterium]|nr:hypothetical protein [Clostridia bacterium]
MTVIGLALVIAGAIIFSAGWVSKPRDGKIIGAGAAVIAGGTLIGIGGNPSKGMPHGSTAMVILGFILAGAGIALFAVLAGKGIKNAREKKRQNIEEQKVAFIKEYEQNGILECRTEKEIQKATLLAQKYRLEFTDISALFYEAKNSRARDTENRQAAAIQSKKDEERRQFETLNRYSSFSGRDKRIAILTDERKEALNEAEMMRITAKTVHDATQQKEQDWATQGGIASGIAGPAAGIATALNVQAKNAEIRAQNQENLKTFAPAIQAAYRKAFEYDSRADALQKQIDEAKIKLVSKDDALTCLSRITFSDTTVDVSETGACTVTTTAKAKQPLLIFDDVKATIDGTVIAKIYDGKSLVGAASLVLPKYGISSEAELKGMCLSCGTPGKHYTVQFAAVNLWAMER